MKGLNYKSLKKWFCIVLSSVIFSVLLPFANMAAVAADEDETTETITVVANTVTGASDLVVVTGSTGVAGWQVSYQDSYSRKSLSITVDSTKILTKIEIMYSDNLMYYYNLGLSSNNQGLTPNNDQTTHTATYTGFSSNTFILDAHENDGGGFFPVESIKVTYKDRPAETTPCSDNSSSEIVQHTHSSEWRTTTEPSRSYDGVSSLICKECGHVEATQIINRDGVVYQEIANKFEADLSRAVVGTTVKIDLGDWHSVPEYLMERIIDCGADVELTYKYKGVDYDIVIPAGKGVNLDIPWYGPLLMNSLYGNK